MKKRKLRSGVIPVCLLVLGILTLVISLIATEPKETMQDIGRLNYVSNIILGEDIRVINTSTKVIYPFQDASVTIGKGFYNYTSSKEEQEKSLIYHENTYIQNSGIDYVNKDTFNVVAVLDGTVTNVKEDEILGKVVEISHSNDYMSVYQSLGEVTVKKGDNVIQGQIIGTSGQNKLDKDLGNHLHFEFCAGGHIVDPNDYLDKELASTTR